jgi:hypothetical protein
MKTIRYFSVVALLSVAAICNGAASETTVTVKNTTSSKTGVFAGGFAGGIIAGITGTIGYQKTAAFYNSLKTSTSSLCNQASSWVSEKATSTQATAGSYYESAKNNMNSLCTKTGNFLSQTKDTIASNLTIAKDALVSSCSKAKEVIMENPKTSAAIAVGTVASIAAYKYRKELQNAAVALKNKTTAFLATPITYGAALGSTALTGLAYLAYANKDMLLEQGTNLVTKALSLVKN